MIKYEKEIKKFEKYASKQIVGIAKSLSKLLDKAAKDADTFPEDAAVFLHVSESIKRLNAIFSTIPEMIYIARRDSKNARATFLESHSGLTEEDLAKVRKLFDEIEKSMGGVDDALH
jgi:hypothetical protein